MTDLMAQRPRIDCCHSVYFVESYRADTDCIKAQTRLLREIVSYQMKNERKANKGTKDYLQAAFKITRDF